MQQRRYELILEARAIISDRFPNAFKAKREQKVPLAIGIHRQLFDAVPDLSRKIIREAVHDYVNGPKYLKNVETGSLRFNLDGTVASMVSLEQAAFARMRLEALQARWDAAAKARKAKQRAQKKSRRPPPVLELKKAS